jgi:hypothetical protein
MNQAQSTIRTMWGGAAKRDDIPMYFLAGIEMVGRKETEKERVLSLDEIKPFFTAVNDKDGSKPHWIIPAVRSKNKKPVRPAHRRVSAQRVKRGGSHDGSTKPSLRPCKRGLIGTRTRCA